MKLVIVLSLVALALASADSFYDPKYDNYDFDAILNNDRLMNSYTLCFIGDGKCTPEGNDINKLIPEGVKTSCAKCTDKQKVIIAKFFKGIKEKHSASYEKLIKKWDPENKHSAELNKFVGKYSN